MENLLQIIEFFSGDIKAVALISPIFVIFLTILTLAETTE